MSSTPRPPRPPRPPSVYDLLPLDYGGVEAREGFAFQDHVSAGFCLDMLAEGTLAEVWCENLDDITLIWIPLAGICVEFVQVKASELNQLWSIAKLCEPDGESDGVGRSILEKSLAQDRCLEPCLFRIVTTRPVQDQLKLLKMPRDAPARLADAAGFDAMHQLMKPKVAAFRSLNGRDYVFWTLNTFWDVRHSEDAVRDANLLKLGGILSAKGLSLAPDQVAELYTHCLKKVWDASRVDPRIAPRKNHILRGEFEAWLTSQATSMGLPTVGMTETLEQKMKRAALAPDVIATAVEEMRHYRAEKLRPKYLRLDEQRLLEGEIMARLQRLKSRLDNGALVDNGVQFHDLCLKELDQLREEVATGVVAPLAFLQGCMYTITGRCLHRFRKVAAA